MLAQENSRMVSCWGSVSFMVAGRAGEPKPRPHPFERTAPIGYPASSRSVSAVALTCCRWIMLSARCAGRARRYVLAPDKIPSEASAWRNHVPDQRATTEREAPAAQQGVKTSLMKEITCASS